MQLRRHLFQLRALCGAAVSFHRMAGRITSPRHPVGRAVHLPGKTDGFNGRPVLGAFSRSVAINTPSPPTMTAAIVLTSADGDAEYSAVRYGWR